MTRNPTIFLLLALLPLPVAWLAVTTAVDRPRDAWIVGLAAASALVAMRSLWRSHRRGGFAPNRCQTCDTGMVALRAGDLKPPPGALSRPRWRCPGCGRLA